LQGGRRRPYKPSRELRAAVDVAGWLAAGLLLRRVAPSISGGDDDVEVGYAVTACANELAALPPTGVIADVAALLAGARFIAGARRADASTLALGDDALRAALVAYDDDVLARLVATPRFDDVVAAFAHLSPGERPAATALVVGAICERAGFVGSAISPATLRRALARPRNERDELGRGELQQPATAQRLAAQYQRLARGARQCRALVDDREVFALDHLAVLRDLGGRMTADHISSAAAAIARTLPRRLPPRRLERGVRETQLADEAQYPAGGFASITPGGATTGNIENLVTSELVYMEDGETIDLFSLRYVEGELLMYTRDDSVFHRHRRMIAFALGPDLDDARVKDRELPWQRLVLALGLVVAATRWLGEQLGDQALTIRLAFPPKLLAEERAIVALLLEGEVASGVVQIVEEKMQDTLAGVDASGAKAVADAVVLSLGARPEVPRKVRAAFVDLARPAPVLSVAPGSIDVPAGPDSWVAWCDCAEDLLRHLV
jgi:hypothetical protein